MGYQFTKHEYAAVRTAANELRALREKGENFIPAYVISDVAERFHMMPSRLSGLLNEWKNYCRTGKR